MARCATDPGWPSRRCTPNESMHPPIDGPAKALAAAGDLGLDPIGPQAVGEDVQDLGPRGEHEHLRNQTRRQGLGILVHRQRSAG